MSESHGCIPILADTIRVSRDIPRALVGKLHWIEWSMFCDRLDEALMPLRNLAATGSTTKTSYFRFRPRKCLQSKVLKKLQSTCDKEAKRHAPFLDFVLYCPVDPRQKQMSVANWHIQVVVNGHHHHQSAPALQVPIDISFPSLAMVVSPNNSEAFSSSSAPSPARSRRVPRRQQSSTSSISSVADGSNNAFADDPFDTSPAASRDGLLALDQQLLLDQQEMSWMNAPSSLGGDYHTTVVPLPPPVDFCKTA